MKDDLLNSIKDRLDSYEESAPEGLWSDIEASVFPKEKPRKAAFVPWMWLSAAAAAVAAVLIVTNTLSNDPKEDRIVAQTDITPSSSVNPGDDPASSEELASLLADADVRPVVPAAPGRVRSMPVKSVPENQASLEPEPEMAVEAEPDVVLEPESEMVVEAEPTVPVEQEQDRRVATNHDGEDWSGYMSATDDGETGFLSRISMKASLAGAATQSQDVSNYDPAMFYYGSGDTRSPGYSDEPTRAFAPMDPLISASSVETDTRHHRPVRMSLTFHMPLGGIFGVETGASYTLLRSTESGVSLAYTSPFVAEVSAKELSLPNVLLFSPSPWLPTLPLPDEKVPKPPLLAAVPGICLTCPSAAATTNRHASSTIQRRSPCPASVVAFMPCNQLFCRKRSTSMAATQPLPAATMAWR